MWYKTDNLLLTDRDISFGTPWGQVFKNLMALRFKAFWCLIPAHLGYYTQISTLNPPCKKQAARFSPWHNLGTSAQWQNGSMGTQQHSDSWASLSKVWPQHFYALQWPNHIFNPLQIGYKIGHWQLCCFRDIPIEVTRDQGQIAGKEPTQFSDSWVSHSKVWPQHLYARQWPEKTFNPF